VIRVSPRELSFVLGGIAGLAAVMGGVLVAWRLRWDRTVAESVMEAAGIHGH